MKDFISLKNIIENNELKFNMFYELKVTEEDTEIPLKILIIKIENGYGAVTIDKIDKSNQYHYQANDESGSKFFFDQYGTFINVIPLRKEDKIKLCELHEQIVLKLLHNV